MALKLKTSAEDHVSREDECDRGLRESREAEQILSFVLDRPKHPSYAESINIQQIMIRGRELRQTDIKHRKAETYLGKT